MESNVPAYRYIRYWFLLKFLLMYALMATDLVFNATVEYGDPTGASTTGQLSSSVAILLLLCQAVFHIIAFLDLFVLFGGTFLFRNGLLGILASRFKSVLFIHPFYMAVTIAVGAARAVLLSENEQLIALWDVQWYVFLSLFQKLVSAMYYVVNIHTLIMLGDPRFYSKDSWIQVYTNVS